MGLAEALAHDRVLAQAGRLVAALVRDPRADGGEILRASSKSHNQVITPTEQRQQKWKGEGCSGGTIAHFLKGHMDRPQVGVHGSAYDLWFGRMPRRLNAMLC